MNAALIGRQIMFLSMKFMSPTLYAIRETPLYLDSHIGFVKQKQKILIFDIHYYVTLNSASKYF